MPYIRTMHAVIETPLYLRDAKHAGLDEEERKAIVDFVAGDPTAGVEIPGTGGARKVRFAGRGRGKSGGHRVVTFYSGEDIPVFLLNVFAKADRIDISQSERNELRRILQSVVRAYRGGVRSRVTRRQ
jgi:hypothetical protein